MAVCSDQLSSSLRSPAVVYSAVSNNKLTQAVVDSSAASNNRIKRLQEVFLGSSSRNSNRAVVSSVGSNNRNPLAPCSGRHRRPVVGFSAVSNNNNRKTPKVVVCSGTLDKVRLTPVVDYLVRPSRGSSSKVEVDFSVDNREVGDYSGINNSNNCHNREAVDSLVVCSSSNKDSNQEVFTVSHRVEVSLRDSSPVILCLVGTSRALWEGYMGLVRTRTR